MVRRLRFGRLTRNTDERRDLGNSGGTRRWHNPDVQIALWETGTVRLVFPLSYSNHPSALARVTPLTLMIERWKQRHSTL